jgi:predicted TIM-barrel fold metal-dependent hydrolase
MPYCAAPDVLSVWRRRDVLIAAASIALAGLSSCRAPQLFPSAPSLGEAQPTGIDIHCHVFNARDLPIVGFVVTVAMEDKPIASRFLKPLIVMLALLMDSCAWPADKEAKAISQGELFADQAITSATTTPLVQRLVADTVAIFQEKRGRYHEFSALADRYLKESGEAPSDLFELEDQDEQFMQLLMSRGGKDVEDSQWLFTQSDLRAQYAAKGVTAIKDELYGTFLLASLLTRRRLDLVQRLSSLPTSAADAHRISLYCPAMVDYSYWLKEKESVTQLASQVAVMTEIAAVKNRSFAVHPWISFCPWRQLVEPGQFDVVQDAVRHKGFIGVKLYPVMGFRPIGNENAWDKDSYPLALRCIAGWDTGLDHALSRLYDWCVLEDVPIMAHCSFSQFPSKAAGRRGAPKEWTKVLERGRWHDLRLNLAHAGGIWDLAKPSNNGWVSAAIDLVRTYPNVYADVADDSDILEQNCGSKCDGEREINELQLLLDKAAQLDRPFDPRKKLMYGTDWVLLSRSIDTADYYAGMRDHFATPLKIDCADFFGMNAARFLGLDRPSNAHLGTTQRLEDFYTAQGLPIDFFTRWHA